MIDKIIVHNLQIIQGQPFEEYLAIKRVSHSWITNGEKPFKATAKTHLGSQVDAYLNEPDRFEGDIKLVKSIATVLINEMGVLYPHMVKQATVLCDFEYKGLLMPYKGRPDWFYKSTIQGIPSIVTDIKVAENVKHTIEHFGYPNQLSGYSIALEIDRYLILSGSPTRFDSKTGMHKVDKLFGIPDEYFWKKSVLKGYPGTRTLNKYV